MKHDLPNNYWMKRFRPILLTYSVLLLLTAVLLNFKPQLNTNNIWVTIGLIDIWVRWRTRQRRRVDRRRRGRAGWNWAIVWSAARRCASPPTTSGHTTWTDAASSNAPTADAATTKALTGSWLTWGQSHFIITLFLLFCHAQYKAMYESHHLFT